MHLRAEHRWNGVFLNGEKGKKGNGESAKGEWCKSKKVEKMKYIEGEIGIYGPNVSKIPISATGCRHSLPLCCTAERQTLTKNPLP